MTKVNINHTEIITWAKMSMKNHGYVVQFAERIVVETPWSVVIKFSTTQGNIYLKQTPPNLFIEATILTALRNECQITHIPELIEANATLHCFLMKDAGRPLREILKHQFDTPLLCKTISQFTLMQLTAANHINILFDIGVPDWRLNKLPGLYMQLLSQEEMLTADGLSEIEINKLKGQQATVCSLCKKLSDYQIEQTIVQPDFNDNNTLINDVSQAIAFIDLGEITISHPLFSLLNCLQQMKKHHGLTEEDNAYLQIIDSCLEHHVNFNSKQHLLNAFKTARILWHIYGALCGYRLMIACGKEKLMSFQHGKLSGSLKEFMTACERIDNP